MFSLDDDPLQLPWLQPLNQLSIDDRILSAAGWNAEQVQEIQEQAEFGREPVGSLGFDGPLAALSKKP